MKVQSIYVDDFGQRSPCFDTLPLLHPHCLDEATERSPDSGAREQRTGGCRSRLGLISRRFCFLRLPLRSDTVAEKLSLPFGFTACLRGGALTLARLSGELRNLDHQKLVATTHIFS